MALTKASLSTKLQTTIGAVLDVSDEALLKNICDAIADAVIDEITTNGTVNPAGLTGYNGFAIQGSGTIL